MRLLFYIYVLMSVGFAIGQSPELRARAAMMKANEYMAENKLPEAIDALSRAKEYSGKPTIEIEYLLTKLHYKQGNWNEAEKSLSSYFELAGETDPHFREMLMMIENLREEEKTRPKERLLNMTEDELWKEVERTRDSVLAFQYLKRFPDGALRNEVCRIMSPYDVPPSITARLYTRYPEKAITEQIETETHTALLINEKGLVERIEHLRVHPYFPVVVEEAVKSSGFAAAKLDGKPVKAWMVVSLKFSVEK